MRRNFGIALFLLGIIGSLSLPHARAQAPDSSDPSKAQVQAVIEEIEGLILELSNKQRSIGSLPPLDNDIHLRDAARLHSAEMAKLNYFEHESPTPGQQMPWDRVNFLGFDSLRIGENIYFAEGYPLAELPSVTVVAWMNCKIHRDNLMNPKYNHAGIGIARHGAEIYVTQVLSWDVTPKEDE